MAVKFYQNQNSFTLGVPTTGGVSINVEPGKFVKDNTGTFYAHISLLTEVSEGHVVASDLVYTFSPIEYVTIDPATGKVPTSLDPSGASGYSGFSGYSGAAGTSGYSGALPNALSVYADNAAAKADGKVDGDFYRTATGAVMIVFT